MTDDQGPHWIHILLKGEEKHDRDVYVEELERSSLSTIVIPPLEFKYKNIEELNKLFIRLIDSNKRLGIIITSPRVVEAVARAVSLMNEDLHLKLNYLLDSDLIFPIGSKTAEEWRKKTSLGCNHNAARTGDGLGLVDFIRGFCDRTLQEETILIYPRGNLANRRIEDELRRVKNLHVETIEIYETSVRPNLADMVTTELKNVAKSTPRVMNVNFVCFSPSGVYGLRRHFDDIIEGCKQSDMEFFFSSIGATTKVALIESKFRVWSTACKPSPRSLVSSLLGALNWSGGHKGVRISSGKVIPTDGSLS